jgi:hypothetical protein
MTQWPPGIFASPSWQMSLGERAALEGLLAQLRPELSIEIGTAAGGSLERIAAHSREVHSIDLVEMEGEPPANARLYVGDSRRVLPEILGGFESEGRNVDFVLVDGDHSAGGVRADLINLLESAAVAATAIVVHDTMNEEVRSGVESVAFERFPKVGYVDLDFLTGYMARNGPFAGELWGGLGLVLVDAGGAARRGESIWEGHRYDARTMVRRAALRPLRTAPRRALQRVRGRGRATG